MRRSLLISLTLGLSVFVHAFPVGKDLPFRDGERIQYGIQFKWGAVNTEVARADVSLSETVCRGVPAYLLEMSARTAPFFDVFYRVRENFKSWFSVDGQRPLQCSRDTQEGSYTAWNRYDYDWEKKVIHADVNFNGRGDEHYEIPLDREVYDLPTLLYRFRTVDVSALKPGQRFPMRFAIDEAVTELTLTYVGREVKPIRNFGKMKTLHFSCTVVGGAIFEGSKPVDIWLSDDRNLLPVAFMAPLRVGAMWGWLKRCEGLKYEQDARIR